MVGFFLLVCVALPFASVFRPAVHPAQQVTRGRASWYGEGYRGKTMANGGVFDPDAMTCAAWLWPLGTLLKVRHVPSGRYVIVEVTDRGPAQWTGRVVDLTSRAFRRLEPLDTGVIPVEVEVIRKGPEMPAFEERPAA